MSLSDKKKLIEYRRNSVELGYDLPIEWQSSIEKRKLDKIAILITLIKS